MRNINEDDEIRILGGSNWKKGKEPVSKVRKPWIYLAVFLIIAITAGIGVYLYIDNRHYGFDYPLSRNQEEVIKSLGTEHMHDSTGIVFSEDSCLGVKMKFYKINGLKAELCDSFPSVDEKDIYLITRSSDYRFDGDKKKIIGDYVRNGKMISKSNWRAGYFAIAGNNAEIGIGRRPDMRSFLIDNKGSMFRQFALVSAGVKCTSQYVLKGKVTRCAYVRMVNDDMYFVETVNPETLYGFSDALIEYDVVDAIYVTGGSQENLFYRDTDGIAHGSYIDDKSHQMVVWKK